MIWNSADDKGYTKRVRRTWCPSVFMKYDEVCDIVGTASLCKVLYYIVSSVNSVRVGKNEAHFLDGQKVNNRAKRYAVQVFFFALANCNNFELGSLDVVRIIFGSIIPALEYSLST
jgi:hypothetical protein